MEMTVPPLVKKEPIISTPLLATLIFIFTEMMIFSSFISSFAIIKSGFENWPPLDQPRLPVFATAINSIFLIVSGFLLQVAYQQFVSGRKFVKALFVWALILGLIFVLGQGYEWTRLIGFGLTMTSSVYGSFFYMIIGAHALHVLIGAVALFLMYKRLVRGSLTRPAFAAMRAYWFFVVLLWPVLYGLVYL